MAPSPIINATAPNKTNNNSTLYLCDRIRGSASFIKLQQNQLKSNLIKASCRVCAFVQNCFT